SESYIISVPFSRKKFNTVVSREARERGRKAGGRERDKAIFPPPSSPSPPASRLLVPANEKFDREGFRPLLEKVIENGKVLKPSPEPSEIRNYVLRQIKNLTL
ncbi:hypothetical protein JGI15_10271, partial [Candidatus Kryptonium thompsonii]